MSSISLCPTAITPAAIWVAAARVAETSNSTNVRPAGLNNVDALPLLRKGGEDCLPQLRSRSLRATPHCLERDQHRNVRGETQREREVTTLPSWRLPAMQPELANSRHDLDEFGEGRRFELIGRAQIVGHL